MPALIFIVPLRNPAVARDWARVSELCNQTLRSTLGQNHEDTLTVLVGSELPLGFQAHDSLKAVIEEFSDPQTKEDQLGDKYRKIQRGLIEVQRLLTTGESTHVMVVDADDLVSRRLAGIVAQDPSSPGWVSNIGYYYPEGTNHVVRHRDFHLYCGTSAIVACKSDDLPHSMDQPKADFPLLAYGHHQIAEHMRTLGTPLKPLGFPGAVYRIGTGENWSGFDYAKVESRRLTVRRWLNTRPLTKRLQTEFHFPNDAA